LAPKDNIKEMMLADKNHNVHHDVTKSAPALHAAIGPAADSQFSASLLDDTWMKQNNVKTMSGMSTKRKIDPNGIARSDT
jgi:hypothetical protein